MRKVCIVVASRANYGRVKSLLRAVDEHPDLELQLIVGASTLIYRFGRVVDIIAEDGFNPVRSLFYVLEGDNLTTQAKSTGIGIQELSTAFDGLKPDMVVTVADRFETMATAIAATFMNFPLIHLQGGEISGNIDDRVRHAITKLADVHFPATEAARENVIRMGENAETVFNYGCPCIDVLVESELSVSSERMSHYGGVGTALDWNKPYVLVVQHAVTTTYGAGFDEMEATLAAIHELGMQAIVLWPNPDAGTGDVSKAIRMFRETHHDAPIHYYRNFAPEDYARVLNNAACAIGNSSSFIREGAYLGVPAVIVGERQEGREHGGNVVFVANDAEAIGKATRAQIEHGRFPSDSRFGTGDAGKRIAEELARVPLKLK